MQAKLEGWRAAGRLHWLNFTGKQILNLMSSMYCKIEMQRRRLPPTSALPPMAPVERPSFALLPECPLPGDACSTMVHLSPFSTHETCYLKLNTLMRVASSHGSMPARGRISQAFTRRQEACWLTNRYSFPALDTSAMRPMQMLPTSTQPHSVQAAKNPRQDQACSAWVLPSGTVSWTGQCAKPHIGKLVGGEG